jgi:hypothetical protein
MGGCVLACVSVYLFAWFALVVERTTAQVDRELSRLQEQFVQLQAELVRAWCRVRLTDTLRLHCCEFGVPTTSVELRMCVVLTMRLWTDRGEGDLDPAQPALGALGCVCPRACLVAAYFVGGIPCRCHRFECV